MAAASDQVDQIFWDALQLGSQEDRAAYLDKACGGDHELRRLVEKLLRAQPKAAAFLEQPIAAEVSSSSAEAAPAMRGATAADGPIREVPGAVIGPYKLLQQIGEGGMGVVWMAEQTEPVKRKVALKVIKPGMDSRQVIARFEAERQALAMMDHVNIARVFDGGTTGEVGSRQSAGAVGSRQSALGSPERGSGSLPPADCRLPTATDGRPYFVMELVHGVPITKYCDDNHLTPRERLELFVPVCQAIQHAHQKGIIHRDIKPSNVMVTLYDGKPVPKVIDFGVAKATEQKLTERTLFTQYGTMIGTLEYMSPEQAEMSALGVDTRSDIYSLGVLLYELLTGSTPLTHKRMKEAAYAEILRMIKEEEPPKPSTRLSDSGEALASISAQRKTEPAKLTKLVKGELDWIVMKTLEKDRNRRYETASAFAADVQRYLADEPVQACPPSAGYRLRKFVRRNRGTVLASLSVLLVLVGGVIGTSWGMVNARSAEASARRAEAQANMDRDRAQEAEADTRAFSDFLVRDVLSAPRPPGQQQGKGRNITLLAAMEYAEQSLEQRFADRPVAEATARQALGVTWRHLGQFPKAEAYLRRALELRMQYLGPDHRDTRETQNSLGVLLTNMERSKEAIPLLEAVFTKAREEFGADADDTLAKQTNLGMALSSIDRSAEAVPLLEDAWDRCRRQSQISLERMITTQSGLGMAYRRAGRTEEAVTHLEQAHQRALKALGGDDQRALSAAWILGTCYWDLGRHADTRVLLDDVLKRNRGLLGNEHPSTLRILQELAHVYARERRWPEAIQLLEEALRLREARFGPEFTPEFNSTLLLARAYFNTGRKAEAIPLYDTVLKLAQPNSGESRAETIAILFERALTYHSWDRPADSIPRFEEGLAVARAKLGADHGDTFKFMAWLGDCQRHAGQTQKALAVYEEIVRLATSKPLVPYAESSMSKIALIYTDRGEYGPAEGWWRRAVASSRGRKDDPLRLAGKLSELGWVLLRQEKWTDAEPVCRECLDLREQWKDPQLGKVAHARRMLGQALAGQRKFDAAESLLLTGYQGLKEAEATIPDRLRFQRLREALESLVNLYEAWGKNSESARWRKELETLKKKTPEVKP